MPRYYFHTDVRDTIGENLLDDGAARREAIMLVGDAISEQPSLLAGVQTFRVSVADKKGAPMFSVVVAVIAAPALVKAYE